MRAFVKGICFAAFAAFALGATGCGKEASCDSAADHVIGIMMKGAEDEIKIAVMNFTDAPVSIRTGDRLAQGIFLQAPQVKWVEAAPGEQSRGGFGATG